jgi:K+-transporting ATPase ATPase C chain
MKAIVQNLFQSVVTLVVMSVVLGLGFPFLILGVAQLAFPAQANGSLVLENGKAVGSSLIGQDWPAPAWFQGRPSATGTKAYNPQASGGSNLSPHGKALADRRAASVAAWAPLAQAAGQTQPVPEGLLTASASGLDPDLDLQATLWQVPLVAHSRGLDADQLKAMVMAHAVEPRWPWDPPTHVNVLALNVDLAHGLAKK